jgi:hypothetical protein
MVAEPDNARCQTPLEKIYIEKKKVVHCFSEGSGSAKKKSVQPDVLQK